MKRLFERAYFNMCDAYLRSMLNEAGKLASSQLSEHKVYIIGITREHRDPSKA